MPSPLSPEAVIATTEPLLPPLAESDGGRRRDSYEPIGELIARRIREAILGGHLAPGTRIRQEALAREFGVSRIPVREALRRVEAEGLLLLTPHSGARVAHLDVEEHAELYGVREVLEPIAIAESVPHLTAARLDDLRAMVELLEVSSDDPLVWLEHDRRFHLATYADAPLPRLLRMIDGFWNTTQQYRRAFLSAVDLRTVTLVNAEHRLILDSLERGDAADAAERQRVHIRRTRVTLMARPDLFDLVTATDRPATQPSPKESSL